MLENECPCHHASGLGHSGNGTAPGVRRCRVGADCLAEDAEWSLRRSPPIAVYALNSLSMAARSLVKMSMPSIFRRVSEQAVF